MSGFTFTYFIFVIFPKIAQSQIYPTLLSAPHIFPVTQNGRINRSLIVMVKPEMFIWKTQIKTEKTFNLLTQEAIS